MTIVTLLLGILLAAALFASFIWSGYQAFFASGWLRHAHAVLALSVLAGAATLSLLLPVTGQITGAMLVVAGLVAIWHDRAWAKLLVAVQIIFGGLLISGLPFAGG